MNTHELHYDVGRIALASCAGPKALESPRVRLQLALAWLQPAPAGLHTGSSRAPGRLQPVPSGSTQLQPGSSHKWSYTEGAAWLRREQRNTDRSALACCMAGRVRNSAWPTEPAAMKIWRRASANVMSDCMNTCIVTKKWMYKRVA